MAGKSYLDMSDTERQAVAVQDTDRLVEARAEAEYEDAEFADYRDEQADALEFYAEAMQQEYYEEPDYLNYL